MPRISERTAEYLMARGYEVEEREHRPGEFDYYIPGPDTTTCYICEQVVAMKETTGPLWDENESGELEPHPICIDCWRGEEWFK